MFFSPDVWYQTKGKDYCRHTHTTIASCFLRFSLSPPISFSSSLFRLLLFYKPCTHVHNLSTERERERDEWYWYDGPYWSPRRALYMCVHQPCSRSSFLGGFCQFDERRKTANREEQEESLRCCVCQKANKGLPSHSALVILYPPNPNVNIISLLNDRGRTSAVTQRNRKNKKKRQKTGGRTRLVSFY